MGVRSLFLRVLGAVVTCTLAAGAAIAQDGTRFARIDYGSDGRPRALQMAIVSYRSADSQRPVVDLVGAVHVGDRGYYEELNQRFVDYDSVLYELVAPDGAPPPEPDDPRQSLLTGGQRMLQGLLDLDFQLDVIDYRAANFVHADLSPDRLSQSMAERNESLYVYFWRAFYASIREASRDPLGLRDWQMIAALARGEGQSFKSRLALEMTRFDSLNDMLDGDNGSAIIAARNERAMQVLDGRLATGDEHLAIFYGVAHMPDFERRLAALGYQPVETRWVDAWRLSEEAPPFEQ